MRRWRTGLAVTGVLLGGYGAARILLELSPPALLALATWLVAALVVHDVLLSPSVVGVGWLLRRLVPDRERRYLQGALIAAGLVTVVALPLIHLRGSQPAAKALLLQDYPAHLGLLVGAVLAGAGAAYLVRVGRDRAARRARRPGAGAA